MDPATRFFRHSKAQNVLLAVALLGASVPGFAATPSVPGFATTPEERAFQQRQYYLLRQYKLTYDEEIFDYCVDKFGPLAVSLGGCLRENDRLKRRILDDARDQLGKQSLAQGFYDECLQYYPTDGVKPVGECVDTRLYLHRELDDVTEERRVYHKCDWKWHQHGYDSVATCARSEVTFYRRWGRFNEE